jgi:hypothetical protein
MCACVASFIHWLFIDTVLVFRELYWDEFGGGGVSGKDMEGHGVGQR